MIIRRFACFPGLRFSPVWIFACCVFFMLGPATPAIAQTNFGSVAVGQSSSATAVKVNFSGQSRVVLSAISVVTQGTSGLDFQQQPATGAGACAVSQIYSPGQSCTVNVVFTPKGVGARMGAVLAFENGETQTLVATSFVSGTGLSPILNFSSTQTAIASGSGTNDGVAVDAAGNVYIAENGATSPTFVGTIGSVVKVPADGSAQRTVFSGATRVGGVAVDGAGNLFIADPSNQRVIEVPFDCTQSGCEITAVSQLDNPAGVAVDGAGNLYIANVGFESAGSVVEAPADGSIQRLIGSGLLGPNGVAVDGQGNVYIADSGNDRVVEVPAGGAGQRTIGSGLKDPMAVAVDGAGNVYIADYLNNRVVLVPADGSAQTTVGTGPFAAVGVAVDGQGNVYINDAAKSVVKVNRTQLPTSVDLGSATTGGTPARTTLSLRNIGNAALTLQTSVTPAQYTESDACGGSVAVNSVCALNLSFAPTSGSPAPGTTVAGRLTLTDNAPNSPQSISLTARAIQTPTQLVFGTPPLAYVLSGGNAGTVKVNAADSLGNLAASFAGSVTLTISGPAGFQPRFYIATAAAGVATFDLTSATLSIPGSYTYTATSAGLTSASATETVVPNAFSYTAAPVGVASSATAVTLVFNAIGTLGSIRVVTQGLTGLDFQQATTGGGGSCVAGQTYTPGQSCTVNVVFTPKGVGVRLGAVLLYDNASSPNIMATAFLAGTGQGGLLHFPNTETPVGSGLSAPTGIAVNAARDLYVADAGNNRVVRVPFGSGSQTTIYTGASGSQLGGVAVDGAGNVYIADRSTGRVVEVPTGGGTPTTIGSQLGSPAGVAVDGAGNVYIADFGSNQVIEVQRSSGAQIPVGSGLNAPQGVAIDAAGNVYIADSGNHRVVKVPSGGGTQTTVAANLDLPGGVAVDAAGNIYIADSGNNQVVKVPPSGGAPTPVGSGFSSPFGLAVDGVGNVYIADLNNKRVVAVGGIPATLNLGNATVGVSSAPATISFTNIGNTSLTLSSATTGAEYKESDTCGGSVTINSSCSLNITVTPTTGSPSPGTTVAGTVTLTDNAPGSPQTISLTAQAIQIPTKLVYGTAPPASIAQGGNAGVVRVNVQDSLGNLAASFAGAVTLTVTGPAGYQTQSYSATAAGGVATFDLSKATLSIPGNYTYTASGAGLTSATATEAVLSTGIVPAITTQPAGPTIQSGQTATLSVVATSSTPLSYQWYLGSSGDIINLIRGANAASYTTPALTEGANYWVRVSNSTGSTDSTSQLVNVIGPAAPATFAGQTSTTQLTLRSAVPSLAGAKINLACAINSIDGKAVTNTNPAEYGITCIFPATVTLSTNAASVPVQIQTTGTTVSASIRDGSPGLRPLYAPALPFPDLLFFGFGGLLASSAKRRRAQWMKLGLVALLLLGITSCGGHFTAPVVKQPAPGAKVTPPGSYYITVSDSLASPAPGFVQTSLIVPLLVAPSSH